jgi:integrase
MRGNITRRGKSSWRIKFDAGTGDDGKRRYHVETIRGARKDAEALLAKRLNELAHGRYVAPTVETVASYAEHWLTNIAPADRCATTVERYATLIRAHILPGLGKVPLQKLDGPMLDRFYARLRKEGRRDGKGLASMTLRHVHRLLSQLLSSAVKAKKLPKSPMTDLQTKPSKAKAKKVDVLDDAELAKLLDHLRGNWFYLPSLLAACTGLRRGEVLGLRWRDLDFAKGTLTVAQSAEVIGGKVVMTAPKTERSRRTIELPASVLPELTLHRKEQAERRLRLGLGKDRDGLVFTNSLGSVIAPEVLSVTFTRAVVAIGIKRITFHALRHGHITALLRAGVPVHVVSARAGHARPSITLDTYAHLLTGDDSAAAKIADALLRKMLNG